MLRLTITLLIIIQTKLMAQSTQPSVVGEYYLRDVMEVGSGFKFNADHSFQFFFSYGAVDREAQGSWEQHGDSIILNNAKKPPLDFKLVQSKKTGNGHITIQIKDPNKNLLRHVFAQLACADSTYQAESNEQGVIVFDKCKAQQLSLIHEFWPDRFSVFTIHDADYFEFTIEPWIVDVAFDHLVLIFQNGALTGPHPILPPKEYTYTK